MIRIATVLLGSTFVFLLIISYVSLDQQYYFSSPNLSPHDAIGLVPTVYLWGSVVVGNYIFRGYEFASAPHAPLNDSIPSNLELRGILRQAKAIDENAKACDFANLMELEGSIALVELGSCSIFTKIINCQQKGAKAVIFNGGNFSQVSVDSISIPVMIMNDDDFTSLVALEGKTGLLWTLPSDFEFSLVRLALVVIVRPLLMLSIILIVLVSNIRRRNKCRKTSPEAVKLLPARDWHHDSLNVWQQQQCSICLEDFDDGCELIIIPCKHEFHKQCLAQWLITRRGTCPLCCQEVLHERSLLLP